MNKGFILVYTLCILISVSGLLSVKYLNTKSFVHTVISSEKVYMRLKAEKNVFDEILFNLSIYLTDDFIHVYESYHFDVKIDEEEVIINVSGEEEYTISLSYNDDCICFIEILYE